MAPKNKPLFAFAENLYKSMADIHTIKASFLFQIDFLYAEQPAFLQTISNFTDISRGFFPVSQIVITCQTDGEPFTREIPVDDFIKAPKDFMNDALLITARDEFGADQFYINFAEALFFVYLRHFFFSKAVTPLQIDLPLLVRYIHRIIELQPEFISFRDNLNYELITYAKDLDTLFIHYFGPLVPNDRELLTTHFQKGVLESIFNLDESVASGILLIRKDIDYVLHPEKAPLSANKQSSEMEAFLKKVETDSEQMTPDLALDWLEKIAAASPNPQSLPQKAENLQATLFKTLQKKGGTKEIASDFQRIWKTGPKFKIDPAEFLKPDPEKHLDEALQNHLNQVQSSMAALKKEKQKRGSKKESKKLFEELYEQMKYYEEALVKYIQKKE